MQGHCPFLKVCAYSQSEFGIFVDRAFNFLLEIGSEMKETVIMEMFASSKTKMQKGFRPTHLFSGFKNKWTKASRRSLR